MKKLLSLLIGTFIYISLFGQVAPADVTATPDKTVTQAGNRLDKNTLETISHIAPDGCVFFTNGKAYMVRNGSATDFKTDIVSFANGAQVTSTGKMTFKDGSTTFLQEGQCVKMNGSFFMQGPAR